MMYTSPQSGRYYKKPPKVFNRPGTAETVERNLSNMLRNKLIAFSLCAALGILLAGCGEQAKNDVSSTVSRVESGVGETVSRVESGMEEAGSRVGSAMESMMDPDSSRKEESSKEESSREESSKEESSRLEDDTTNPSPAPEPR